MLQKSVSVLALLVLAPAPLAAQAAHADTGRVVDGQLVTDTFAVSHTWKEESLQVSIRSDLPDDADLMVSVDRLYWERGSSDAYSIPYLSEKNSIGAWEDETHEVAIDDGWWRDSLQAKQRQMAGIGMPFQVRRVEDSVRVRFIVPVNQDDPRFGRGNSRLVGQAVREEGLSVVEKELVLAKPLGQDPAPSPWVSREDLKPGRTYVISESAPLVPAFEPEDPVAAAQATVSMLGGTHITVREVRRKDGIPWYRIRAARPTGEEIGAGWLNSAALIGQPIRRVDG